VAETAAGADELQVSGTLLSMFPKTSSTVAVTGCAVPLVLLKLVWPLWTPETPNCRVMLCTGQVSKKFRVGKAAWVNALLETPLAEA
jgi:hypothetical protein